MSATGPVDPQTAQAVREQVVNVLDRLASTASEYGLPQPPEAFETYRKKLRDNRYTVLVAGEAKRGKSTFVNAILGRDLLPTDVDIATAQVFRVRQASAEGFRVRFENGTAKEITAEDLSRFGSQGGAADGEALWLRRMIRWIEVEGPIHFLPREITLLDTPGLGSLYAAHARITRRYVPSADAVIFVLSSDSPIGLEEVKFLNAIVEVTGNILFIQTMIDLYDPKHWKAIRARNEQILAEKLGARLLDGRVWPISSTNLLRAAQTGDVDFEEVSKIRPLAAALQAFLFRAAGWIRAAEAVLLARDYQMSGARSLAFRQSSLREELAGDRKARQDGIAFGRREFEAAWGERGKKRQELLDQIRLHAQLSKQDFLQTVGRNNKIHVQHSNRIKALKNIEQARTLAAVLADDVVNESAAAWESVCDRAQERACELLAPFVEETEVCIAIPRSRDSARAPTPYADPQLRRDRIVMLKAAINEGRWAAGTFVYGASVTGAILVPTLLTATVFMPVVVFGALGAALLGVLRGLNLASGRQLEEAQRELENHLATVLQCVQKHYFNVSLDAGRFALVDEYFNTLQGSISAYVDRVAETRSREAQAELDRQIQESRLDEQERKERTEWLSRQISIWNQLADRLQKLEAVLNESSDS